MFKFVIGANLQTNEAFETLKAECGEFNFPQSLHIENLMPRDVVDAQVSLFLDSNLKPAGVTEAEVEFPTFGHLIKFATDMEYVAKLNGFSRAIVISGQSSSESKDESAQHSSRSKGRKKRTEPTVEVEPTVEEEVSHGD